MKRILYGVTLWLLLCSLSLGVGFIGMALSQSVPSSNTPIQFVTSEVESLKLENLKLRAEVNNLHKALAEAQLTLEQIRLGNDTQLYSTETLKAHGNPPGVHLDLGTLKWKVEEPKAK